MDIQINSRSQLAEGRENIRTRQNNTPKRGITGTNGQRNGRCACGFISAHYEDGGADDDKGKKCADIDQLGEYVEGDKRGH